jgi:hypothetical protein
MFVESELMVFDQHVAANAQRKRAMALPGWFWCSVKASLITDQDVVRERSALFDEN